MRSFCLCRMSSRGCPYQCTFCDRTVFGNRCRIHSPEYIMEMIKKLYFDFGIREIAFNDDNLVVFKKQLIRLCHMLIDSKLNISWICLGSVNAVDKELLKLMKRAGCWQIMWGIETGSQELLKLHNKPANLEQTRKALEDTRRAGIRNNEMHNTYLQLYPNTDVWRTADKYGAFSREWWAMGAMKPNFVPFGLTSEILEKYQKKFYISFYLWPRIILYFLAKCRRPRAAMRIFKTGLDFLKLIFRTLIIKRDYKKIKKA